MTMAPRTSLTGRLAVPVLSLLLFTGACGGGGGDENGGAAGAKLTGVFRIDAGVCSGTSTSGSFFRMVQPGGKPGKGPYVTNTDSSCKDETWTALSPGSDGGISTVAYQSNPAQAFTGRGDGVADTVIQPQTWFAVNFSCTTNETDPQTKKSAPLPEITVDGGKLSGQTSAYSCAWNRQYFNQGAPKPDGSMPGNTSLPTGTYDDATKHFVLEWASQIVGGPFNNFTGTWHLEGTFEPD
jgi:hypothetical protein